MSLQKLGVIILGVWYFIYSKYLSGAASRFCKQITNINVQCLLVCYMTMYVMIYVYVAQQ